MRSHVLILILARGALGLAALMLLSLPYVGLFALYAAASLAVAGALFLAVGLRARRGVADWEPPAAVSPLAPPASEDDLDALPEPVVACPHCGSLAVRPLQMGEGGIPGVSEIADARACGRCGYHGLPVEFATREDYADFLRLVAAGSGASSSAPSS